MKSRAILTALVALTISSAAIAAEATATAATNPADAVLARVNDEPVTVSQVLSIFSDRHSGHARFLGGDVELRKFLDIVIDDQLLVQEAWDLGLDENETVRQLVSNFERDKIAKALLRLELDAKAQPTDEDVKKVWSDSLGVVAQVHQIVLPTREDAEQVRTALLRHADAETFARLCSVADSRTRGGILMVTWGNLPIDAERAVFAGEEGGVTPVIATDNGFEVYTIDARIDVPRPEYEQVVSEIRAILARRLLEGRKTEFSSELWSKYHAMVEPIDLAPRALARTLESKPDTTIAKWDGGTLTLKETFDRDDLALLASLPSEFALRQIDNRIRLTVNSPLVELEAKSRKIEERPEIAKEIDAYRDYVMEAMLFRDHMFRNLAVTDEETRQYFDAHPDEFQEPEQRRVAQILVGTQQAADDAFTKASAGSDFGELAKKMSRDMVTSGKGGEIGWITADKVSPAFAEVLSATAGQVVRPVRDDSGWHIVKVLEVKPKQALSFDAAKEKVREKLLEQRKRTIRNDWVAKLRGVSKIEIDDAAISEFVKRNEFDEKAAPPQHVIQ